MDNHSFNEITKTAAVQPSNDGIRSAAILAYDAGYTPQQAVMVEDNSRAVKQMFPGSQAKQETAYVLMMHDQHMEGYPSLALTDLNQLSAKEIGKVEKYAADYKPSIDVSKVAKEEQELIRLGFPRMASN